MVNKKRVSKKKLINQNKDKYKNRSHKINKKHSNKL